MFNNENNIMNKYVKFVCNPATFKKPEGSQFGVLQAQLFCYNCSTRVNMTEENSKTISQELITAPLDQQIFDHSPMYGGICLRPECGPVYKFSNFKV